MKDSFIGREKFSSIDEPTLHANICSVLSYGLVLTLQRREPHEE
jgi:hypothetical protein